MMSLELYRYLRDAVEGFSYCFPGQHRVTCQHAYMFENAPIVLNEADAADFRNELIRRYKYILSFTDDMFPTEWQREIAKQQKIKKINEIKQAATEFEV